MLTKLFAAVVAAVGVAAVGTYYATSPAGLESASTGGPCPEAKKSCCASAPVSADCCPDGDCCVAGAACCEATGATVVAKADCCPSGDCCVPGAACCGTAKTKATAKADCCPGGDCCVAGAACCGTAAVATKVVQVK